MDDYRFKLKAKIIEKYGSVSEWTKVHNVSPERFYNFIKGSYNPTLSTFEKWLDSIDASISLKENKK